MDVFEAVAEPNRRALLDLLLLGERSAGELVASLPALTQPAVSRHLRVLRDTGLVEVRSDAQRRIYALRPQGLAALDAWLNRYRRFWAGHLDALERHLAALHGPAATREADEADEAGEASEAGEDGEPERAEETSTTTTPTGDREQQP